MYVLYGEVPDLEVRSFSSAVYRLVYQLEGYVLLRV